MGFGLGLGIGLGLGLGLGFGLELLSVVAHLVVWRGVAHLHRVLLLKARVLAHLLHLRADGARRRLGEHRLVGPRAEYDQSALALGRVVSRLVAIEDQVDQQVVAAERVPIDDDGAWLGAGLGLG